MTWLVLSWHWIYILSAGLARDRVVEAAGEAVGEVLREVLHVAEEEGGAGGGDVAEVDGQKNLSPQLNNWMLT